MAFLTTIFPNRHIAKTPIGFNGKAKPKGKSKKAISTTKLTIKSKPSKLLWQSGPLKERDLTIPKSVNTHQTGSMLLTQGLMKGIDQRHFFRDNVFSELDWKNDLNPRRAHIERAVAKFKIIISGVEKGDFTLKLSHSTDKISKSYIQHNGMTSLVWGEARPTIANIDLIGMNAKLYKNRGKQDEFTLIIE